jgi:hypothetical protein
MVSKRAVSMLLASTAVLAGLVGCGGGADVPTVAPTVGPTAIPVPTPVPSPTVAALACSPTPPPLYGIFVKVQQDSGGRKTLDSRPRVINIDGYCEKVGFSGFFCFVRKEDDPQAQACDYMAMGKASDTGRYGPTWSVDGKPCSEDDSTGCRNHPDNQFLVIAKGEGDFSACAAPEIPLSQDPVRPGSRCGICRIAKGESRCQGIAF